ncbi:bifunctional diaminohydroxyphosphoribosylaminopyrimidine deaminase/5-amino-6-(5-phosphoribosylamino)uracil reductase RibD [Paracoccaceae bacterium Fryx2]|nr:bifunctional diaminohydroxyphosphoribosylaminopyrimidine deaminase/5-amino-6-(5-phosphoribosylamino)uracil reductase RibD [Paracoccaceae bacterium Fryx2]
MSDAETDRRFMAHALALGQRGLGQTWPNPAVGCVIVQGSRIVGRGWTQPGGRPHAERRALDQAGGAARGATAYVSLEPCAHHGHTPPCAEALIAAGVARVVTALTDPDPRVAGQGHAMLRGAGIAVTEGVLHTDGAAANAGFLKRVMQGLPFVTLKLATTLDGRIATAAGESRWITGPQARRATHALRLSHDAVMVGSGTARADDPDLTVRDLGATRQPVRIVIDSRLSHSPASRLGQTAAGSAVWICHGNAAPPEARATWEATGATLIACATDHGHLNLRDALQRLAQRGLTRILCEGGAALAAALVRDKLVDELALFTAGALIGGDGVAALGPLNLTSLADAPRLRRLSAGTSGEDTFTRWAF